MVIECWRSPLRWTYTSTLPSIEERQVRQVINGHSRLEARDIRVSAELVGYLDWPYLQQVFELRRTWTLNDVPKQEAHYRITELPATGQVLTLK